MRQPTVAELRQETIAVAKKNEYDRRYSFTDLLMLFLVFSFAGWLWEVFFRLIVDGNLTNGGILYGPWLPIYGFGCLAAIVLLRGTAEKPLALFFWSCLFCSIIEYGTGWYLSWRQGLRWWDYSNVPFNLNGYICLPVSLVFGLACMVVIYSFAPHLTNLFHRIPKVPRVILTAVLIALFLCDFIYAQWHPHIRAELVKSIL